MQAGALSCDIEFIALGYYYLETEYEISETTSGGYSYTYPFIYEDATSGEVIIESDTNIDSPCKISIFGPCANPSWSHYVNGEEVGSGKVNCTVNAGERLIIDCQSIPYSIRKYDNFLTEVDDCYGESDFATGRFVYIKKGTNKLSFAHEGTESLSIVISVKSNYQGA